MQKTLKRYFPIFVLPTLIAFSFAFIIPFVMLFIGFEICNLDDNNVLLDNAGKKAYQNYGY